MSRTLRGLAKLLSVAGVAYFVLWACAPPTAMPPPVPFIEGAQNEMGAAVVGGVAGYDTSYLGPSLDGQLWYRRQLKNKLNLGIVAAGGSVDSQGYGALGTTLQGRFNDSDSDNVIVGWKVGAGWMWGKIGIPIAVRVGEDAWVYTEPSGGISFRSAFQLPVGLSLPLGESGRFNTELGLHALGYTDYNPYFSLGVAKQF